MESSTLLCEFRGCVCCIVLSIISKRNKKSLSFVTQKFKNVFNVNFYGLFTLTETDLDTDSESGFQAQWLRCIKEKFLHCKESDSDSSPDCQVQEWDLNPSSAM